MQARIPRVVRNRQRKGKFGRRIGPSKEDVVSCAKVSGTHKKNWMVRRPACARLASARLAIPYERSEQVHSDLADVDKKKFDKEFEEMAMEKVKEA